jgi:hypothetical protein
VGDGFVARDADGAGEGGGAVGGEHGG